MFKEAICVSPLWHGISWASTSAVTADNAYCLPWMNWSCPNAVWFLFLFFFWLWQFLINFVCIQLWEMLRAEMRKPYLKIRLFYSIKYNSRTMLCLSVKLTIVHVDWWCFFLCSSRYLECWNTYNEELNGYSAFSVDCVMEHYMC